MAVDFKARLAKLKGEQSESPPAKEPETAPSRGVDFKARLANLRNAAKPPENAPAGRFPSTQQRGRMDQMGSAEDRMGDLAGGFNTALFDVLDLPSTVYNMGMDVTGNENLKVAPTMSALRPYLADRTETMKNTENPIQDFLRTFTEWGGGVGTSLQALAKAPKIATALRETGKGTDRLGRATDFIRAPFMNKGPQTYRKGVSQAPEVGMATGAATGEAIGGETGELIGGITGAFTPAGYKKFVGDNSLGQIDADVEQFILDTAGEEGLARLKRAIAEGEVGSFGDLSRSEGINRAEKALAALSVKNGSDKFDVPYQAREEQVENMFGETLTPSGPDSPLIGDRAAADRTRNRDRIIDAERSMQTGAKDVNAQTLAQSRAAEQAALTDAQRARQTSREADADIGGEMRTDQASVRAAEAYKKLDKDLKEQVVAPAWKKFEEIKEFETKQLQEDLSKFSEDLPKDVREDLNRQYKSVMNKLQNMEDIADPRDIQYVLSSIKQVARKARVDNNFGPIEKQLSEVQNIVNEALANGERIGKPFQDAIAATVEQKARLGGRKGGDALAKALESPETFVDDFGGFTSNEGANAVARIMASKDPEVMSAMEEALRSELRRTDINEKTLIRYEAALDSFPDVKRDLTNAVAKRQTLEEAERAAKEVASREGKTQQEANTLLTQSLNKIRTKADGTRGKLKNLTLSKFAAAPNDYIDKALKDKDDTDSLGRLYKRFQQQGDEYGEAFRSKVLSRLKNDILSANRVGDGLADDLDRLMKNGIITDSNRQQVIDIIAMQEGRRLRRKVKAGGDALDANPGMQNSLDDALSTALALPILSALPSSHQLMAAGMIKRTIGKYIRQKRFDPERLNKLTEAMANPQRFMEALGGNITKNTTPEEIADKFGRAFVDLGIFSGRLDDKED